MRGMRDAAGKKKGATSRSRPARLERRGLYLTSNSRVCTTLPSCITSTLYLPVGQPSGLAMWNSVLPAPVRVTSRVSSLTTWLLSTWVHFTPSLLGTAAAGSLVLVPIDTWMVSFGAKVVAGVPTFMSAPMVLPRSTVDTVAVPAMGAGAGPGIGAGSVVV